MIAGEMDAPSYLAVIAHLQDLGHLPIEAAPTKGGGIETLLQKDIFGSRNPSKAELAFVTHELATLLQAGLPLDRAFEVMIDLAETKRMRKLLSDTLERIRDGASLSDALRKNGDIFPGSFLSMVSAGEAGGALETTLLRLAEFLEKSAAVTETVKSAMVYPAILLAVGTGSIVTIITVVVPEFKPLFENAGAKLPTATRMMIAAGDFLGENWWTLLLSAIAIVGAVILALRQPAVQIKRDALTLKLPIFGDLIAKTETAGFARTLGTLLKSGIPLPSSLTIARDTFRNQTLGKAIEEVTISLKEGDGLAGPLTKTELFPPLALHLMKVGEETGKLEDMLVRLADIFDRDAQRKVSRLLTLLVPAITILFGLIIAGIIASVMVAVLGLNDLAV